MSSLKVKLMIGNKTYNHVFRVLKGVKREMIIGNDFLEAHQATLDYREKTIKLGKQVIKLTSEDMTSQVEGALLETSERVHVEPNHVHYVGCKTKSRISPGTYVVEFLETAPYFSEQPSLALPPTLVEITDEQTATLSLANSAPVNYTIPQKTLIGIAEKIDLESYNQIDTKHLEATAGLTLVHNS